MNAGAALAPAYLRLEQPHGCCGCDQRPVMPPTSAHGIISQSLGFAMGEFSSAGFFESGNFLDHERFQGFGELLPEFPDLILRSGLFGGVHVQSG